MTPNHDSTIPAADILVVDDTIESLKLLTEILTQAGYQVRPADGSHVALESALAHPPSLILLDVKMPEMSGFEVCRRLKQDERTGDIPIIFVSALQDVDDRLQGFEAGGVDFVSKPFQEAEVLARVKTHLQLRKMGLYLEALVAERTAELKEANKVLAEEIQERKQAEQEIEAYQQKLKALAAELTLTEEQERRRIAADLHDEVGQTLAFARIQLAAAREDMAESEVTIMLDDVSDIIRQAIRDTRDLVFDLSSPLLNELGLAAALAEWLEEQVEKKYGLQTEFKMAGEKIVLDEDVRAILFRNVRELLNNVVKHAQAGKVSVRLAHVGDEAIVVVEDDGNGFNPLAAAEATDRKGGFGLFSVRERMLDLGGSLEIVSEPGQGCTAILTAPLGNN